MLIIGCGNRERGDDAAGILVAEKLRKLDIKANTCAGQAAELIDAWAGADDVIVVDAIMSGAPPGTLRIWDAKQDLIPAQAPASTHGLGVAEAIRLACVLGCLPPRLHVYGIEGRRFEHGAGISSEVNFAVDRVVDNIVGAIAGSTAEREGPDLVSEPNA